MDYTNHFFTISNNDFIVKVKTTKLKKVNYI